MSRLIPLFVLSILLTSCDQKKIIYVAPTTVKCDGNKNGECLQVKENLEDEWTVISQAIDGFEYKEGVTHKIEVNISKANNSSSNINELRYKLERIIYQEPAKTMTQTASTLSGSWKVAKMTGMEDLTKAPTIVFKDGKISGNAGCNSYSANYTIEGNTMKIGLAAATKMYCTNMKIEDAFFECLRKTKSFKIKDSQLYLYSESNEELLSSVLAN